MFSVSRHVSAFAIFLVAMIFAGAEPASANPYAQCQMLRDAMQQRLCMQRVQRQLQYQQQEATRRQQDAMRQQQMLIQQQQQRAQQEAQRQQQMRAQQQQRAQQQEAHRRAAAAQQQKARADQDARQKARAQQEAQRRAAAAQRQQPKARAAQDVQKKGAMQPSRTATPGPTGSAPASKTPTVPAATRPAAVTSRRAQTVARRPMPTQQPVGAQKPAAGTTWAANTTTKSATPAVTASARQRQLQQAQRNQAVAAHTRAGTNPGPAPGVATGVGPGGATIVPIASRTLTPQQIERCTEDANALQINSQRWQGSVQEISLKLGRQQKAMFEGRCAGHPQAARYIAGAERMIVQGNPAGSSPSPAAAAAPTSTIGPQIRPVATQSAAGRDGTGIYGIPAGKTPQRGTTDEEVRATRFPIPDRANCLYQKWYTRGRQCGNARSAEVIFINQCTETVAAHVCLFNTKNNKWSCGADSNLAPGKRFHQWTCESNGQIAYATCSLPTMRAKSGNCGGGNPEVRPTYYSFPTTRAPARPKNKGVND